MKIHSTLPSREPLPVFASRSRCAETLYHSSLVSLKICNPFRMVWQWIVSLFCCCKKKRLTAAERMEELARFKDFVRDHWNKEDHSYVRTWSKLDQVTRQAMIEKSLAALREKASHSEFSYSDQELFDGAVNFVSDPLSPDCNMRVLIMNHKNYHTSAQELLFTLIDQVTSDGAP